MMNICLEDKLQNIVDSYDTFPFTTSSLKSMMEEQAELIVTELRLEDKSIWNLDFDSLFNKINLKDWISHEK